MIVDSGHKRNQIQIQRIFRDPMIRRENHALHAGFVDVLGSRQIDEVDLSQILRLIFPIDLGWKNGGRMNKTCLKLSVATQGSIHLCQETSIDDDLKNCTAPILDSQNNKLFALRLCFGMENCVFATLCGAIG